MNGLELDTDFDGEINVEAGDAVEDDVTGALDTARDAVNAATADGVGDISADRSDAYNQAIIDEQQSVNDKALSDAQEAVDGVDGLQSDVEQLEATQADYRAAFEADAEATTELNGELAKANEVNDTTSWSNSLEGDLQADLSTVASEGDAVITDTAATPNPVIVLGANGQLEAADGLDTSGIDGFDALLTDAQAAYDASEDLSSATTAFEEAITAVVEAEGNSVTTVGGNYDSSSVDTAGDLTTTFSGNAPLTDALLNAETAINTFDQAVENYGSAKDNADQLASLNQDVDDANDAIQNDEDEGGLGVSLLPADDYVAGDDVTATTEDDVVLFSEDFDGASIDDFGASGEDKIFFGEGYSLVALGDDAIEDNVGDSNAQEIFWEQAGDAVNLYVEAETFGGNSAGEADVTKVTLTGVDGADISDNLGNGFLSAGTEVA